MCHKKETATLNSTNKCNFCTGLNDIFFKQGREVSREIRRNMDLRTKKYNHKLAQRKYQKRLHEKPKRIRFTPAIKEFVDKLLLQDYSPEQIKGRMSLLGQDMVSHERIYQYVWHDKKRGDELYKHLRRKGRKYWKRGSFKDSRGCCTPSPQTTAKSLQTIRPLRKHWALTSTSHNMIQEKLNNRPRIKLRFLTPYEYFFRTFAKI